MLSKWSLKHTRVTLSHRGRVRVTNCRRTPLFTNCNSAPRSFLIPRKNINFTSHSKQFPQQGTHVCIELCSCANNMPNEFNCCKMAQGKLLCSTGCAAVPGTFFTPKSTILHQRFEASRILSNTTNGSAQQHAFLTGLNIHTWNLTDLLRWSK